MCDFSLCTDATINTSELNISLQGAKQLVIEISDKIIALERRLRLWEIQLKSNNMTYLPILETEKTTGNKECTKEIRLLQYEFNSCFQYVCNYDATISLFSMAFDVNAETATVGFQIEMTDLRCDTSMRNAFRHVRFLEVYKL
jgi:hypothetical protein